MNLYEYEPPQRGERFDRLFMKDGIEVVRIVSTSIDAPKSFCDERDEWVVLLQGEAIVKINDQEIKMVAGDTLYIPAHTPHQLLSVSKGALWLAFHFSCGEK